MKQITPGQFIRTTRRFKIVYWQAIGAVEIWTLDWRLVRVRFLRHKNNSKKYCTKLVQYCKKVLPLFCAC